MRAANHRPEVCPLTDCLYSLKFTVVILIIVFTERNLGSLHLVFFLCKSPDNVTVFGYGHGQVKHVDVINIDYIDPILNIPRFRCIGNEFEIGIGSPFQIDHAPCFFFEFSNRASERVQNLSSATPACNKGPFPVAPVMDHKEVRDIIHCAHRNCDRLVSLSSHSALLILWK